MKHPLLTLGVSAITCAACLTSARGTIAYNVPAGTVGNQGYPEGLGLDFNVRAPGGITINALGAFDSSGDGLIGGTIQVGVFDRTTALLTGASASFTGSVDPLVDGSRIQPLGGASFVLPRGFRGSIVAAGYSGGDLLNGNGNGGPVLWTTNDGGGAISFVGQGRFASGGAGFSYPTNQDGGPPNRYAAGTFDFAQNAYTGPHTALYVDPESTGNQDFGGALGMDFTVNSEISVRSLGAFDSLGNGFTAGTTITASLWSRTGNSGSFLTSLTFDEVAPGTLDTGNNRFKDLASPLILAPGDYTIVGEGFNVNDNNGNVGVTPIPASYIDDGAGMISFTGSRYSLVNGSFPDTPDGVEANRYYAGTFIYVPEPASALTLTLGAALIALRRRGNRLPV